MKGKMNKKLLVLIAIIILTLSIASVGFAGENYTALKAWYRDIKIFRNNQQVQMDIKPFIVDDTTYVPLRALANIFDKEVTWDGVNYHIGVNDKLDTNLASMTTQILIQQQTITQLESKVKDLTTQLASKQTSSNSSLSDMEKYLNKEHGVSNKIEFDIELSGTKSKMEVGIYLDLYDHSSRWNSLSSTKIKEYIQDIVDDIRYDFEDAKITGFIEDIDKDKELVSFTVSTKGIVSVSTKTTSKDTLYDLEDDLNYYYYKYEGVEFDIELDGDRDEVEVSIYVDEDELDDLTDREIEKYLEKIYDYIIDEFPYAEVYGYIYDYDNVKLHNFDFYDDGYLYWK